MKADVEQEALAALDRGDTRAALEVLMRAYKAAVFRFCRRMLGDDALADDVRQQTFIQAFSDLPRFSRRSSLRTWLFSVARHRCLDASKIRQRSQQLFLHPGDLPDQPDGSESAEHRVQRGSVQRAIDACLNELTPATRAAVVLRYVQNFSYEEMAVACGEKAGTLQARVARSMPLLQQCLEAKGVTP